MSGFTFKAVPPPAGQSFGSIGQGQSKNSAVNKDGNSVNNYFASARQKNEKLRNYFDDDDDDETPSSSSASAAAAAIDDDYDPLDAFM